MQIQSSVVADILSRAGFDWIAVDLEHGAFSLDQLPALFSIMKRYGVVALARVAQNHPKDIKQALDAGAEGVIVPMVGSQADMKHLVEWASYPPRGSRGIGFSNANAFGGTFENYFQNFNDEMILVAQLESIEAVGNIESMLSVEGIDALMIGPYDLSGSMGLTGQFDHPDFLAAMNRVKLAAEQRGVPMGTHIVQPDSDRLEAAIESGSRFIAYSTDSVLLRSSLNSISQRIGK